MYLCVWYSHTLHASLLYFVSHHAGCHQEPASCKDQEPARHHHDTDQHQDHLNITDIRPSSAGSSRGQQHGRINWVFFHQIFLWTNISGTWQNCSFSINLKSKQIIYIFIRHRVLEHHLDFLLAKQKSPCHLQYRPPQVLCAAGITTTLLFSGELEAESVGLMFQMTFNACRAYFSLFLQIWIKSHLHYIQVLPPRASV